MPPRIPARNEQAIAKRKTYPSMAPAYERIKHFADRYRAGTVTADGIPPTEREAVMVYLLEHPRRYEARIA